MEKFGPQKRSILEILPQKLISESASYSNIDGDGGVDERLLIEGSLV
jgi:hypothetical protein